MHPEMTYRIAVLRHEERLRARRFPAPTETGRRRWFRRRRDLLTTGVGQPVSIVLLPPPREQREPADQRVA